MSKAVNPKAVFDVDEYQQIEMTHNSGLATGRWIARYKTAAMKITDGEFTALYVVITLIDHTHIPDGAEFNCGGKLAVGVDRFGFYVFNDMPSYLAANYVEEKMPMLAKQFGPRLTEKFATFLGAVREGLHDVKASEIKAEDLPF